MKINTKIIQTYIKDNNLTKAEFCRQCDISASALNRILKNERANMTYSIMNISKTLNVEIQDLLQ